MHQKALYKTDQNNHATHEHANNDHGVAQRREPRSVKVKPTQPRTLKHYALKARGYVDRVPDQRFLSLTSNHKEVKQPQQPKLQLKLEEQHGLSKNIS